MWLKRSSSIMNAFILSIAAALSFFPSVSVAELYKWTDEQGHFHITDIPPPATQKKSVLTVVPGPQSASSKKARVQPVTPEQPRAEAHPLPAPIVTPSAGEELPTQLTIEGLNPFQAMGVSPWQVFDRSEREARAPVQLWKDKRGLDHVVDVLPATKGAAEARTRIEAQSLSGSARKGKKQSAEVSTSHQRATE